VGAIGALTANGSFVCARFLTPTLFFFFFFLFSFFSFYFLFFFFFIFSYFFLFSCFSLFFLIFFLLYFKQQFLAINDAFSNLFPGADQPLALHAGVSARSALSAPQRLSHSPRKATFFSPFFGLSNTLPIRWFCTTRTPTLIPAPIN